MPAQQTLLLWPLRRGTASSAVVAASKRASASRPERDARAAQIAARAAVADRASPWDEGDARCTAAASRPGTNATRTRNAAAKSAVRDGGRRRADAVRSCMGTALQAVAVGNRTSVARDGASGAGSGGGADRWLLFQMSQRSCCQNFCEHWTSSRACV